jgi:dihydroneopterin triphosphate diphosphatase
MRAPLNVVVVPFLLKEGNDPRYCLLRRKDAGWWESVAGGGEDDETPPQAAIRELREETGIEGPLIALDARSSVPRTAFAAHVHWPPDLYVIPQHAFAVEASSDAIQLSAEHTEFCWLRYEEARNLLHWQSNQVALWELSERLGRSDLRFAQGASS